MSLRVLVTGADGFTGRHLVEYLKGDAACELFCSTKSAGNDMDCDLRDPQAVSVLLEKTKPDQIYHLAGSFSQDYETDYARNVLSTRNILEAALKLGLDARILLVGSAAEYGAIGPRDNPVKESQPLNPVSVYGLTKVYQTYLMNYYFANYEMNIVMARTFNLLGSGISPALFVGKLLEQIAAFTKGEQPLIELGNLDHYRDYIAVDAAVKDYARIMNYGSAGTVYHVASGKPIQMRDLLKRILEEYPVPADKVRENAGRNPGKFNVPSIYADVSRVEALRALEASKSPSVPAQA